MAMIRAKYGVVGAALAVASVIGSGCADYSGLLILQNQPVSPDTCSASTDRGVFISHGFALVGAGGGYVFAPLIQSALVNREDTMNGDIVAIHSADVELQAVDSADSKAVIDALQELKGANRKVSGSVDPGGVITVTFPVIDSAQAMAMGTKVALGQSVEIIARVRVFGDTAGTEVSSQDFYYPITISNLPGANFVDLGPCDSLAVGRTGIDNDCFGNGQDGAFVECCTSAGGVPVCPARGPTS
jgi:hypothetical protein